MPLSPEKTPTDSSRSQHMPQYYSIYLLHVWPRKFSNWYLCAGTQNRCVCVQVFWEQRCGFSQPLSPPGCKLWQLSKPNIMGAPFSSAYTFPCPRLGSWMYVWDVLILRGNLYVGDIHPNYLCPSYSSLCSFFFISSAVANLLCTSSEHPQR